jgi:uncharacterized repeat protein (TIGR01451 family)
MAIALLAPGRVEGQVGQTEQTIAVTSLAPGRGASGDCTLGEAIEAANTDAPVDACEAGTGADLITVPEGVLHITERYPIDPTEGFGLPVIRSDITIRGAHRSLTFIQRGEFDAHGAPIAPVADPFGIFLVVATGLELPRTGRLQLEHVTMRGGYTQEWGAAVLVKHALATIRDAAFTHNVASSGGAVAGNGGSVTVERTHFVDNSATYDGGALYGTGILAVSDSVFARNSTGSVGGALAWAGAGSTGSIVHSHFSLNTSEWAGGAIHNSAVMSVSSSEIRANTLRSGFEGSGLSSGGTLTLVDSTIRYNTHGSGLAVRGTTRVTGSLIANNHSSTGGGVTAGGTVTIENSTISGNEATWHGGGVYADHGEITTLNNVTITNNVALNGEGGGLYRGFRMQDFRLANSIVAANSGNGGVPDTVSEHGPGSITSLGYNVLGVNSYVATIAGDQAGTMAAPLDPLLGLLEDSGGPTFTHALLDGSPALEAGSPASAGDPGACGTVDQRGLARPGRIACDIGAFERQNMLPTVDAQLITAPEDTAVDFTITGHDGEGDAIAFVISLQPQHGIVTGNGPTFTYTPQVNFNGTDSFTVFAADQFNTGPEQTISVTVTPVNDPPTAIDDVAHAVANVAVSIAPMENDTDAPDAGETLTIVAVTEPIYGDVVVTEGGTRVHYTPEAGRTGGDSFTYSISDGNGGTATAMVKVLVEPSMDLALSLAATATPGVGRAELRYLLTVSNVGGVAATNIVTSLTLPEGLTYATHDCSRTGNVINCTTWSLAPGASVTYETLASTTTEGSVTATAALISADQVDTIAANNTATASTDVTVIPAVVSIEIVESITVSDAPDVTPAVQIEIAESIAVSDEPDVVPAVQIDVTESIAVSDAPDVIPPVEPDQTPPSIVILSPQPVTLPLNQAVVADYSCSDSESGVASCLGPVASGAPISTSRVGGGAFEVTATDNAGNVATTSVPYSVTYNICMLSDQSKTHNAGGVVPIRLQLCDAAGVIVSSESIAITALTLHHTSGATAVIETVGGPNAGNAFSYDSGSYRLTLKTKKALASGSWTMDFAVGGDPVVHSVQLKIK